MAVLYAKLRARPERAYQSRRYQTEMDRPGTVAQYLHHLGQGKWKVPQRDLHECLEVRSEIDILPEKPVAGEYE